MSKEICQRCGTNDYDNRTLWMKCFYAMEELNIPFNHITLESDLFYTLRVCKDCRGDWMTAIKTWFNDKPVRESCGSGIFVRRNGVTVEITKEEWYEKNPGCEPARVIS